MRVRNKAKDAFSIQWTSMQATRSLDCACTGVWWLGGSEDGMSFTVQDKCGNRAVARSSMDSFALMNCDTKRPASMGGLSRGECQTQFSQHIDPTGAYMRGDMCTSVGDGEHRIGFGSCVVSAWKPRPQSKPLCTECVRRRTAMQRHMQQHTGKPVR